MRDLRGGPEVQAKIGCVIAASEQAMAGNRDLVCRMSPTSKSVFALEKTASFQAFITKGDQWHHRSNTQ